MPDPMCPVEASSSIHRYARIVDPDAGDSLATLVRWIRPRTAVLDVGTAGGALGQYLKEQQECLVDGVDIDVAGAALARRHYRRLVVADLERSDLAALFPPASYDYVVCADVLEHLRQPLRVLVAARRLLREGGHLLISVPNVAYAPLLAELLGGQMQYRPVGLLDESHLRFLTRPALTQLLASAGFTGAALARVVKQAHESEFGTGYLEALPPAVRRFLEGMEEAYTYQFLVDAVASEQPFGAEPGEARSDMPASQSWPLPLRYVARLYWQTEGSAYGADRQVAVLGEIGAGMQTLKLTVPQEVQPITGLLLELADREAIVELQALRVCGPDGPVWSWSGLAEDLERAVHERISFVERTGSAPGVQAVIEGREPRLELPVGAADLAACERGCSVEVDVGWPLSPEYMQVLDRLQDRFSELAAARRQVTELIEERDLLGALLKERLQLLRRTEAAWQEAVGERDRAVVLLEERLALLQAREQAWQEAVRERDRALALLDQRQALLQSVSHRVEELEAEGAKLRKLAARQGLDLIGVGPAGRGGRRS